MTPVGLNDHEPLRLLTEQYRDGANLSARMRLHERFSTGPVPWPRWVFDQLDLRPRCSVLELGCGTGALWSANRDRLPAGCRVILSDLSTGMLCAARQALGPGTFEFVAAGAQALPFADAAFDLIVANHMLYHVPEPERAIAEARRVLRDGGRLYAATNGRAHLRELDAIARRFLPEVTLGESAERFSLETGRPLLERAFSTVDDVLRYEDGLAITEAEPVVEYVLSTVPNADSDRIDALRRHLQALIAREGAFRVRKDTGLFVARA